MSPPAPLPTPVWEDVAGPLPPLTRLEGEVSADACVIGLGGSGLACISSLLARGVDVVALDAGGVAAGAAGRNGGFWLAGIARFHHEAVRTHGRARAVAIYRETLAEMDRMVIETPGAVDRCGSLRIADDDAELQDCLVQLREMRTDGLGAEPYEGPEGKGILFPYDGTLQPVERCRILAGDAIAGGARLYIDSPALRVGGDLVETPHGAVRCRHVFVCVDGSLAGVLPELSGEVRSARLQMLATKPVGDVDIPRPVYARGGLDYWQQIRAGEGLGRVALGGCRDVGGEEEWGAPPLPSERVQAALDRILSERLRISAEVTHRWAALVSFTTSGLPVVREVRPGVFAAGGYSGTGNVVGAVAARALVRLALDGRHDLADLLDAQTRHSIPPPPHRFS